MMTANHRSERCWSLSPEYENRRLRLIVADGTPGYLDTVRNVLEFHDIVDLLGRAANFEETIHLTVNLRPDLVLLDIEMQSAMVAIAAISTTSADVEIVGMFNACIPLHAPGLLLSVGAFMDKARFCNDFLPVLHAVITENLVCMPTPSAEENDRGGLEVAERRVLDRKAGSAKRNPVSAREEIALVNTTNGSYSRRSTD